MGGLHDFLLERVLPQYARPGGRAIDLGAGSGALAVQLQSFGLDVLACDLDREGYRAPSKFVGLDLNDVAFGTTLGRFDLVTAVEVIEHLESPIRFLRNVAALLAEGGVAVVTTPNVDSLPARGKLLIKGTLRMFDHHGDPTHISPIFWDLLVRQYLRSSGLRLLEHHLYPANGFRAGRPLYRRVLQLAAPVIGRGNLLGDSHIIVLANHP